jgi:hypothetical protein
VSVFSQGGKRDPGTWELWNPDSPPVRGLVAATIDIEEHSHYLYSKGIPMHGIALIVTAAVLMMAGVVVQEVGAANTTRAAIPAAGLTALPASVTAKEFAVCIVGAPRSMAEPSVHGTMGENLLNGYTPDQYDIFYYLTVGVEVSVKGSGSSYKGKEASLAPMLQHATQVRLQYNESPPLCRSVTAARWSKVGRCAHMAVNYSSTHNITYRMMYVFRPDQTFHPGFLPAVQLALPNEPWYSIWCYGDAIAVDGRAGIHALLHVHAKMKCCNVKLREPRACFVPSRTLPNGTLYEPAAPEPNWLFDRYLESQLHNKLDWLRRVAAIGGGNAFIIRPAGWDQAVNPHQYTLSQVTRAGPLLLSESHRPKLTTPMAVLL